MQKTQTCQKESNKIKELEAKLTETQWLHEEKNIVGTKPYIPYYGDVTQLNTERTILDTVGKTMLHDLTSDLMDLLDTSVAIYEKNGDYAYGVFSSGWCQIMDASSRKLCNTADNKTALTCGNWLCHDDCWNNSAKAAITTKKSTDIDCIGKIKLYAEPIFFGNEVIGAINIGYGNPPTDDKSLQELSKKFNIELDTLKNKALEYNPRPEFIIQIAKKRLKSIAKLIGETVRRKQAEYKLNNRVKELNCISKLSELVETKSNLKDILSELIYILKQSWEFPEITEVKITYNGYLFQTKHYKETKWKMGSDIKSQKKAKGKIEIIYLKNPTRLPDPFLKEEYNLLHLVTERLDKTIERFEKSKQYEELFNTINEAIIKSDKNGIITETNQVAVKLCGYENTEDLIGKSITVLYPNPHFREKLIEKLKQEGGVFHNLEFPLKKKNGTIIPTICNTQMLLDHKNELAGTLGTFRDISELRKTEQALKDSKKNYQILADSTFEAIFISENGICINQNQKAEEMFGYTLDEAKGHHGTNWIHPDYHETVAENMKKNITEPYQCLASKKDGTNFWVEIQAKTTVINKKKLRITALRDISKQKQTEQALKESELKFKSLFENAQAAIVFFDTDFKLVLLNKNSVKLLNKNKEELIGKSIYDLFPNVGHLHVQRFKKIMKTKKAEIFEDLFKLPDEEKWFSSLIQPFYNNKDQLIGIQIIAIDITDKKQIEQALKESELKHKTLFELANDAIFIADTETGKIIDANKKAEKLLGRSRNEMIGMHHSKIHPHTDINKAKASFEQDVLLKDKNILKEFYVIHKNGTKIPVEINPSIIEINEKKYVYGIFRDITDRKKAEQVLKKTEESLRLVIKGSNDAPWDWDLIKDELDYSPQWWKQIGYQPNELEPHSLLWEQLMHPDDKKHVDEVFRGALQSQKDNYAVEFRLKHKKGHYVPVLSRGFITFNQNNEPIRVSGTNQDLTERKKAEQKTKDNEERLKSIEKIAHVGSYELDLITGDTFWSDETFKIFELNPETDKEPTVGEYEKLVHEEDIEELNKLIAKSIETGQRFDLIYRIKTITGKIRYVHSIGEVDTDANGKSIKMRGTFQDITERKKVEQDLKENKEKLAKQNIIFQTLLDNLTQGVFMVEAPIGKPIIVNQAAFKILGRGILPDTNKENLQTIYKAYKESTGELYPPEEMPIIKGMYGKKSYINDMIIETDNGIKRNIEVFGSPIINEKGEVWASIASFNDITDRKKTEQEQHNNELRLKTLVNIFRKDFKTKKELLDYTLDEAIKFTHSKAGYIYFYNEQKEQFTLYTWSKQAMKQCKVENPKRIYNLKETGLWGETVRQRKPIIVNDYNAPNPYKKGYPVGHFEISNFLTIPVIIDNEIIAVIGVANKKTDYVQNDVLHLTILMNNSWKIIQKIEWENQIEKQNKQLRNVIKQKNTFLQVLGHDLRNPFSTLMGFSELLKRNLYKYDINKIEKQVGYINTIATKTYKMLDELLLWAKAQQNRLPFNPEPHNIKDVFQEEIKMLETIANQKNITINTNLPDNLIAKFDAGMMKTKIRNLVSNAIKFTEHNGFINVSVQNQNDNILVSVTDTGIGMQKKCLDSLWKNTELKSTEGTAGEKGTGFGLLLCKEFVKKHGGKIWAESEINKGSTFYFTIPQIKKP